VRARAREKESAGERENYPQRFASPVVRSCVCERERVCVFECVRAKERAKQTKRERKERERGREGERKRARGR